MMKLTTRMAVVAVSLTATIAAASPALAKARHHHRTLYLNSAPVSARDAALRECNEAVKPYNDRDFEGTQIIRYNGCMFAHGQIP